MNKIVISTLFCCLTSLVFGVEEREGFFKQLYTPETILTVPTGKKFVILQLLCREPDRSWQLTVDGNTIFTQNIFGSVRTSPGYNYGSSVAANFDITFPDRCVTIEAGKSLVFETTSNAYLTIVGYFYNYNCESYPVSDLNKDCKVNFADLAVLAAEWLSDNTVPA